MRSAGSPVCETRCATGVISPGPGGASPSTAPAVRRVTLPFPAGDRVLQTAAALVMTPIIDRQLEDASYAYRPGRSVRQAVARVAELRDAGFVHIADSISTPSMK